MRINITLLGKHPEREGALFHCTSLGSGSMYSFTFLEEEKTCTQKEIWVNVLQVVFQMWIVTCLNNIPYRCSGEKVRHFSKKCLTDTHRWKTVPEGDR